MKGLLSSTNIKTILLDPDKKDTWVLTFKGHEFDKLPEGKGVGIAPFSIQQLGPVSYDLTVGEEAQPLRRADKFPLSPGGEPLKIAPGETVLVLTREFLAFSPRFAAITLSRARIMNEGIALSSAKIDPTWYGCLLIPITNNSRRQVTLRYGERFCTMLVFELDAPIEPTQYLTKENTPHLGQSTFEYEPRHAVPWEPMRPEAVSTKDMDKAVAFGPPFDIIRGMFDCSQRKIVDYMEQQWGPNALRQLKHSAWEEEFQQIKEYREQEVSLLKEQIGILKEQGAAARADRRTQFTLALGILVAIVGWLATVGTIVFKAFFDTGGDP